MRDHTGSYKSFNIHTESWWASSNPLDDGVVEEIMVGIYHKDGGTSGEFPFVWRRVGQNTWVRLEAWNDGWAALVNMPELLQMMHDMDDDAGSNGDSISPKEFAERLKALGYRDRTARSLDDKRRVELEDEALRVE